MDQLATRQKTRYDELVRSYAAFRELRKTPDFKPGTPTLADLNIQPSRQVEEAANARAATLRNYRLELMKRGY
jgi:hypothetical protein